MIYTLTGNLLWERTFTFASWTPGKTQRAQAESAQVGGKGINVAKMLRRLGNPTTALCFAGGPPGAECRAWLEAREIPHRSFLTESPTRSGLVVHAADQPETTFLGPDAPPDTAALRECAEFLQGCPDGSLLAFCGSFPGWETRSADPLRAALDSWIRRCRLFVDTYGPPLRWFVERPTELIKINRDEFDTLFAGDSPGADASMQSKIEAARKRFPARNWIVTDGPGSVWVAPADTVPTILQPPEVQEVSPTGSGDVMFAGVLHGLTVQGLSLPAAAAFALPYAAANAADTRVAEFDLNNLPGSRSLDL
jgi:1-phosphofructokinase